MWNSLRLWNLDFPVSRQSWGSGGPGSGQGIENVSLQLMPQANNKKEALNKMTIKMLPGGLLPSPGGSPSCLSGPRVGM